MPDEWEIQYGLNPHNPADADLDPDIDGVTNLDEFLNETDPTRPPSGEFQVTITDFTDRIEFDKWLPGFEKVLKIEVKWDKIATDMDAPDKAAFKLEDTSSYPGRAVNDVDSSATNPDYLAWYEFNGPDFGLAEDPADHSYIQGPIEITNQGDAQNGIYTIYLQCWDYGARTKLVITHPSDSNISYSIWIPIGAGINGIAKAWDYDNDPGTTGDSNALDPNADMDEIIFEKPGVYTAPAGDDFKNIEEYRGIIYTVPGGDPPTRDRKHIRLNATRKDLFVRGDGFDPVRAPFAIGDAFKNAGIDVHIVNDWGLDTAEFGSFYVYYKSGNIENITGNRVIGAGTAWSPQWPRREWEFKLVGDPDDHWMPITYWSATGLTLAFPYQRNIDGGAQAYLIRKPVPHINIAIMRHDWKENSPIPFNDGYINFIRSYAPSLFFPQGARQWGWDQKGHASTNSTEYQPTMYGFATTYQIPLEHYFNDRPYIEGTLWTATGWTSNPVEDGLLAPLNRVEDQADKLEFVDGALGDSANGIWDGDYRSKDQSTWYENDQQLSPFDVDKNGFVELPLATDPDAENFANQYDNEGNPYTLARVLQHTITHELTHTLAGPKHTEDPLCLMYKYSINWSRDHFLSDYYRSLLRIHNILR
jgi:hypothetical protein